MWCSVKYAISWRNDFPFVSERDQGWSWAVSGPYQLRNRFGQKYLYVEMVRSK
nr:hypothetical protein [Bacteroides intestinalis]